jgi:predicted nucleotidyltransferase
MYIFMYIYYALARYADQMPVPDVSTVITVASARTDLSRILRSFRSEPTTPPVVLGSHRNAEAVLISYEQFRQLTAAQSIAAPDDSGHDDSGHNQSVLAESLLALLLQRRGLITRLAQLSHIRSVSVFGAVARDEDAGAGDIDLLVEPDVAMTPADLAQFKTDLEQLCGRPVDLVDARSLLPGADGGIRSEAVLLSER